MSYQQIITPKIPTKNRNTGTNFFRRYCHAFVCQAFTAPRLDGYGTANAAFEKAEYKHQGTPPLGLYVPVWFEIDYDPAGHVAYQEPDGQIVTTGWNDTYRRFPNLAWFLKVWPALTYLGWTEDINKTRVVAPISPAGKLDPLTLKGTEMLFLFINDGKGRYGAIGQGYYAVFDGRNFTELSKEDATAISAGTGASFANVTYDAWEKFKATAGR